MARVIDPTPQAEVEKQTNCYKGCGARIAYVPRDVKSYRYSACGEMDTAYYVSCPQCGSDVIVR